MAKIMFQLDSLMRHDEDAKVYVGYIPALDLFTQASTEDRLPAALYSAVHQYLGVCHKRKMLDAVLERYGFQAADGVTAEQARREGSQYVEIAEDMPQYATASWLSKSRYR